MSLFCLKTFSGFYCNKIQLPSVVWKALCNLAFVRLTIPLTLSPHYLCFLSIPQTSNSLISATELVHWPISFSSDACFLASPCHSTSASVSPPWRGLAWSSPRKSSPGQSLLKHTILILPSTGLNRIFFTYLLINYPLQP